MPNHNNRLAVCIRVLLLAALVMFAPTGRAADWMSLITGTGGDLYALDTESIDKLPDKRLRIWVRRLAAKPFEAGKTGRVANIEHTQFLIDCNRPAMALARFLYYDSRGDMVGDESFRTQDSDMVQIASESRFNRVVQYACQRAYGKPPALIPVDARARANANWTYLTRSQAGTWYVADEQVRTFRDAAPNYVLHLLENDLAKPRSIQGGIEVTTMVTLYSTDCTDLNSLILSTGFYDKTGVQVYHSDTDLDARTGGRPVVPGPGSVLEVAARRACAVGFKGKAPNTASAAPPAAAAPPAKKPEEKKPEEPGIGTGTGWHVGNGLIVTAAHVVRNAKSVSVIDQDRQPQRATILQFDEKNDVAVLSVGAAGRSWRSVSLARGPAALGSRVLTIGYPLLPDLGTAPKVTSGEISSTEGMFNDPTLYQISAPIQPGNSGGPLFNMNGEVVGMVVSKLDEAYAAKNLGTLPQNINYAVKLRYIEVLLEEANRGALPQRTAAKRELRPEEIAGQNRDAVFIIMAVTAPQAK